MVIEVLALGASLKKYKDVGNVTVGVNDIFSRHKVDHLVVIDPPSRFTPERIDVIKKSTPKKFYTHRTEWEVSNLNPIKLAQGRGILKELDSDAFCHSNNTAYIAVVLAYKLGARTILIHGADFTNHWALSKENQRIRVLNDFEGLIKELRKRNVFVYVSSKDSLLSTLVPVLS